MARSVEEKLVIGLGALALLVLVARVLSLLWTGAVQARRPFRKTGER
ncbi:MAG: hypothetical protein HGA96_08450 [Desulfobulbaceae bacterium]|nr:hypothetical protein [Desulfobulbaceae bacterium]